MVLEVPHDLVAVLPSFFANASEAVSTICLDELPGMSEAPVDSAAHSGPGEGLNEQDVGLFADLEELGDVD